jgi:hypothetical protein
VSRRFQRRLGVLLVSAGAAFGVWKFIPGTAVDRLAFKAISGALGDPRMLVSGQGTPAVPWALRNKSAEFMPAKSLPVVSLGDDAEGVFQSSPPAPIDFSVIFANIQRLGVKRAAIAAILAWEKPDPIGLVALEKSMDRFESLVMAAPLSRGSEPVAMPPAFRRASIPLTAIHGAAATLPVVNRVPLPGMIFGGEKTLAGFSMLEVEAAAGASLVARWEDRVVFAFPVLAALQRLNLPVGGMEVRLGESLKLGPKGPIVPIDDFGRLAVPMKSATAPGIPAEALIDGSADLFPKPLPNSVILRDDRSTADPATREFSRTLAATVAIIGSDGVLREFPRLAAKWEISILLGVVLALAALCGATKFKRHYGVLMLAGICLVAQSAALAYASLWLPGLPAFAAILAALVTAKRIRTKIPDPAAVSETKTSPELRRIVQFVKQPRPNPTPTHHEPD